MGKSGGMGDLMKMQQKLAEVQEGLRGKTVEGAAGGGMVKATLNGHHEVIGVRIDPVSVDPDDLELLEDLIVAAIADGRSKAEEMAAEEMRNAVSEMGLPPMLANQLLGQ